jgi:DNA-binding Lrp family transcriptional regulator
MSPRRSVAWMVSRWPRTSPVPYDVIARVQAPGPDQLGRLMVSRIQLVDGVTRTLTCTVLHR